MWQACPSRPRPARRPLSDFVSTAGVANTGDLNAYRTLLPQTDQASIAGTYKHDLNDKVGMTLSGSLEDSSSFSYLGLPGVTLTLPSANPFSPFGDDVLLYRYVDRPDALTRQTDTRTIGLGTVFRRLSGRLALDGDGRLQPGHDGHLHRARPERGGAAGGDHGQRPVGQSLRRHRRPGDGARARHRPFDGPDGDRRNWC